MKQFGFLKKSNTLPCCLDLCTGLRNDLNKHLAVGCLFIDFKKAYDSVNHRILLKKLRSQGLTGSAFDLVHSYLSDRNQFFSVDNVRSPLLDDLFQCGFKRCKGSLYLYADDTAFQYSACSLGELQAMIQRDLDVLDVWSTENLMVVNSDSVRSFFSGTNLPIDYFNVYQTSVLIVSLKNDLIKHHFPLQVNSDLHDHFTTFCTLYLLQFSFWKICDYESRFSFFLNNLPTNFHSWFWFKSQLKIYL